MAGTRDVPGTTEALAVLDVGTTSTRAFVLDLDGVLISEAREPNRLDTPLPGRAEQDPIALRADAEAVVRRAVADAGGTGADIRGLVVSTQMHSLLVTDVAGEPRTPLIGWADTRATEAVAAVRRRSDWHALYGRTGCPPHPSYPLYKLMALRVTGDAPGPTDRIEDLKSWLLRSWTGERVVDRSLASGSGLLDVHLLRWDPEALDLAGIAEEQLPAIVDTTHVDRLSTDRLGLAAGTPIVAGAGDGVLSSLGCGAHEAGTAAIMVGTSGAVRVGSAVPIADPSGRLFSYYLADGRWIVGGALSNGGIVLDWLGRLLRTGAERILALAAEAPAGAGGVICLPFLAGERAPGYQALARGAWFGFGLEHDGRHLARAALEGIAFTIRSVLEAAEESVPTIADIRATGGLARSRTWLRILAGVIDRPLGVPADVEGSAVGALVLGAHALGLRAGLDLSGVVHVDEQVTSEPGDRAMYDAAYDLYQRLDRALRPEFPALAALRSVPRLVTT